MAAVRHLRFSYFAILVRNSNCAYFYIDMQIGEDQTIRGQVNAYFRFSKWRPSAIFDFNMQNVVKIGQSTAGLLHTFNFQNGGRPPSWIWYDVISDHPQLVFDGPNILLKLHVDRLFTWQDITNFIFSPFGLKLPIHAPFWEFLGILPPNEF